MWESDWKLERSGTWSEPGTSTLLRISTENNFIIYFFKEQDDHSHGNRKDHFYLEVPFTAAVAAVHHPQIDREESGLCSCESRFIYLFIINIFIRREGDITKGIVTAYDTVCHIVHSFSMGTRELLNVCMKKGIQITFYEYLFFLYNWTGQNRHTPNEKRIN